MKIHPRQAVTAERPERQGEGTRATRSFSSRQPEQSRRRISRDALIMRKVREQTRRVKTARYAGRGATSRASV